MPKAHIVLLPREGYWAWEKAARDYVSTFGINVTPHPETAGNIGNSEGVVTIIDLPNGYPKQGSIQEYFLKNFPSLILDIVEVEKPLELKSVLEMRINDQDEFGLGSGKETKASATADFQLIWPTDVYSITQRFGVNPEIYTQWGLPGHEGLDIRAPYNSKVYACAEGEVYRINDVPDNHSYGRHVRIRHPQGYRTVYAHMARIDVKVGDQVSVRQQIGVVASTGNSSGSYLHLTLKKDNASDMGETNYPNDILDPTPFLLFPTQDSDLLPNPHIYPWSFENCLVGASLAQQAEIRKLDLEILDVARIEAVKISSSTNTQDISDLRSQEPTIFLLAQLHYLLGEEHIQPEKWVARILPDMHRLIDSGISYYEIHRSPNLQSQGWNYSWYSGSDFARWWMDVVNLLKDRFPDALYGFPGLSPGDQVEGQRMDSQVFMQGAEAALLHADWIGVNCYWSSLKQMQSDEYGMNYKKMRERFPDKVLFITEFANVSDNVGYEEKGKQYVTYYKNLKEVPGMGAAFFNAPQSSTGLKDGQTRSQDSGLNSIAAELGKRELNK